MDKLNKIIKLVIGLLFILFAVGMMLFISDYKTQKSHKENVLKAQDNLSGANINLIKAGLNVYYVTYKKYPNNIENLDKASEWPANKLDINEIKQAIDTINNFSYEVRGDEKAYKITYTDKYGNKKEIIGNYESDFH